MELLLEKGESGLGHLITWAPRLVGAILVLIIGLWIINRLMVVISRAMKHSGLDGSVVPFLSSLISVVLKVLLILSVAGMLGIETTSFIALLGMLGLAIGMALQGTLGHFASGVMILLFKPYGVGDLVEIEGQLGHVEGIQVFNTVIRSPQNKQIIIPNGVVTNGIIVNRSAFDYVRIDLSIMIAYVEDFERIQAVILAAIRATPKVLNTPVPEVEISSFGEYNIHLDVYPYARPDDYWSVYYGTYKNIKSALQEHGVKIVFPEYKAIDVGGNEMNLTQTYKVA